MKQPKSFASAVAESLCLLAPYWVMGVAVLSLVAILDFAWVESLSVLALSYLGLGACVVFVLLKEPSQQDIQRIDMLGSLKNLYRAAWWPWYVWQRLVRKG